MSGAVESDLARYLDLYRDAVELRLLAARAGATVGEQAYAEGVEAQMRQGIVDLVRALVAQPGGRPAADRGWACLDLVGRLAARGLLTLRRARAAAPVARAVDRLRELKSEVVHG